MKKQHCNSGNVLFIILIAVALFAALSYAVVGSSRGGGKNVSDEQAELIASTILDFSAHVRAAVTRVRTLNGCARTEISFFSDQTIMSSVIENYYINPNSPSDNRCHIFHPNGGNLKHPYSLHDIEGVTDNTNTAYQNYQFTERVSVAGHGGTNLGDIMIFVDFVREPVCRAFNRLVLKLDDIPSETTYSDFLKAYNGSPEVSGFISSSEFYGVWEGCYYDDGHGRYKIFTLLWVN